MSSKLSYAQHALPAKFTLRARTPREALLIVGPALVDLESLKLAGWEPEIWEQGRVCTLENLNQIPHEHYGAILAPALLRYCAEPGPVLDLLKHKVKGDGSVWTFLPNGEYQASILAKATRELRPWPHDLPHGRALTLDGWRRVLGDEGDWLEILDPAVQNPQFARWGQIDALDVRLVLPAQAQAKLKLFTMGWALSFKKAALDSSLNYEAAVAQIALDLEAGRIETVAERVALLRQKAPQDPRLPNFLGIEAFYRQDPLAAYEAFLDALELAPNNPDYWDNAADAAAHLGQGEALAELRVARGM